MSGSENSESDSFKIETKETRKTKEMLQMTRHKRAFCRLIQKKHHLRHIGCKISKKACILILKKVVCN